MARRRAAAGAVEVFEIETRGEQDMKVWTWRTRGALGLLAVLGLAACEHEHDDGHTHDSDAHADEHTHDGGHETDGGHEHDGGHGEGTALLEVTADGESDVEQGLAAADFADGWAVTFSKFEVVIADVSAADHEFAGPFTADLSADSMGQGHVLTSHEVPEGHHGSPGFTLVSLSVEGTGVLDGTTKTFAWTFNTPTVYSACVTAVHVHADPEAHDGPSGRFEITLHGAQLFSATLGDPDAERFFGPLAAADADADGAISQAELAAAALPASYTGADAAVVDLGAWLAPRR
jgi:hypothetical protein